MTAVSLDRRLDGSNTVREESRLGALRRHFIDPGSALSPSVN